MTETIIRKRLKSHPAVILVGPRQVGKTTLAQALGRVYFDLEQEGDRLKLDVNWSELMASDQLVILDEAQDWPELFPRLRGAIDQDRARKGRFLLLGSIAPRLMKDVSESLAGRLAIVELGPLSMNEVPQASLDDLWLYGGYPENGVCNPEIFPVWHRDYLSMLCQRDLPNWGLTARPQVSERLVRMLATIHGQVFNASQLANSLGISGETVKTYVHYFEGAFLVRKLQPYFANMKKRLVKSPKYFWRDSGLLHSIMGISTWDQLLSQPWVGASWEGFVNEQILLQLQQLDCHVEPYHFRTSDGYEVDLVLDFGAERWAIESKLSSNPSVSDMRRLGKAAGFVQVTKRVLISRSGESQTSGDDISCALPDFLAYLRQTFGTRQ